ncbi:hypothetical protein [Nitrosovibrio tenuis]|uniref:Uncharacterized protein n=1 Tax=Nitrosovibrio tenuis TaxID=1233 RepID=A0A1H7P7C7_9PROT|nr:hypothetical protein [Nitrosovibrio tenuis]SEL31155.1 hypothetical protein SAMN05216387_10868 [Nitrosovibrio tenuis]
MRANGAGWSSRAAGLLHSFVEAACHSGMLRRLLEGDPSAALREWQWECNNVPPSLPPPSNAISVAIDDATLLGPVHWRTEPEEELLRQPQLRLLLAGAKPLALIHGNERSLTALANWARVRGYFGVLGPHEFLPQHDSDKGEYSNRMIDVTSAQAGSGAWRGLLLAPDEQTVLIAWLCQLFGWEGLLGRLLGYPPCCCDAFEDRWPIASQKYEGDVGLMYLAEVSSRAGEPVHELNWTVNIFARYFGWEVIQHFPCHWGCMATTALAQRYFSVLSHYWPTEMQKTLQHLAAPLLVIPNHGFSLFPGGRVVRENGSASLIYEPELVQVIGMEGALVDSITSSPRLTSSRGGGWQIGGSKVPGWLLNINSDPAAVEGTMR